jgi:hypothetical protein
LVYSNLKENLNKLFIKKEIFVITRQSDKKTINYWNERIKEEKNLKKDINIKIVEFKHYDIDGRHNMGSLTIKCNALRYYFLNSSHNLFFMLESDIVLNSDSLLKHYEKIKHNSITCSYYDMPNFCYPLIAHFQDDKLAMCNLLENKYLINSNILGHGLGAVMMRREVLENTFFESESILGLNPAQDIGFFMNAHKNKHNVLLLDDYVNHIYKR